MKKCSRCDLTKHDFEFHKSSRLKSGLSSACRLCVNASTKRSYFADPEKSRKRARDYRVSNPDAGRDAKYRYKYGITLRTFEEMLVDQKGVCAICKSANKLAVDHDHKTGLVRGLLCYSCNSGIGQFRDNPTYLEAAIRYLGESP